MTAARMTVRNRHHVSPLLVDPAVEVPLDERLAPARIARLAVERQLHDVVSRHQRGRKRTRHQESIRIPRMPHGDVTRRIEHALIDEDAAGRGEIFEKIAVHGVRPHPRTARAPAQA